MSANQNDVILAEILRGDRVESVHAGTAVVVDHKGRTVLALGDVEAPTYPRSTVKALLALDLVASGAAERLTLSDAELALACASHNGEPEHARTAAHMLARVGRDVGCLECGTHWPTRAETMQALAATGAAPTPLHNNCSGKHAGLICLACDQGHDPAGYIAPDHPAMAQVTRTLAHITGAAHEPAKAGVDGCSMPTYAIPLRALAHGFARFGTGQDLGADHAHAATRLRQAVAIHPFMVAGTDRFDTRLMEHFKERAFIKMGAEGVMVASLPEQGLGIALKVRDGANRAAELAMAALIARFLPLDHHGDETALRAFTHPVMRNWRGIEIGTMRPASSVS